MEAETSPPTTLSARLRSETTPEHRGLEAGLGFDLHQPDFAMALGMLRGFYGVLRDLEPAMLALAPAELRDRSKLAVLRRDLSALGMDEGAIDAIASPASAWNPQTPADAMGALYVMEGSTLGGKLIVKALRRLPEWTIEGGCYFDPYGAETGSRWNAFKTILDNFDPVDGDAVVAAAKRTFALLDRWMVETKA